MVCTHYRYPKDVKSSNASALLLLLTTLLLFPSPPYTPSVHQKVGKVNQNFGVLWMFTWK